MSVFEIPLMHIKDSRITFILAEYAEIKNELQPFEPFLLPYFSLLLYYQIRKLRTWKIQQN